MSMVKERYDKYIKEYNAIIRSLDIEPHLAIFKEQAKDYYNESQILQFSKGVDAELSVLELYLG